MARGADPHSDREEIEEGRQSAGALAALLLGPSLWALHFLVVYVAAAIACARAPEALTAVRAGIGGATVAALVAIVLLMLPAWREWRRAGDAPSDGGTREGRQRLLAFTALLLCGLSAVAVVFSALPAALAGTCS